MKGSKVSKGYFVTVFIIALLLNSSLFGQDPKQSLINVSKITSWVRDDGFHDWLLGTSPDQWNGNYPNGKDVGVIFSEGICWGGLVYDGQDQKVRVNGNTYGTGCSPNTRLYRVRTDYYKADLINDAESFFMKDLKDLTNEDLETLKNQYEKDWNEWPADKGAPYFDIDKDGKYNPGVDIPGVPGALQTLWIDYNDDLSNQLYVSNPIGLEIQETYWAYTSLDPIGNVIYKKVDIIYKGTSISSSDSRIDSMYISEWSDTGIGEYERNYAGCDKSLNLGYAYHADKTDAYFDALGLAPPAVDYCFLQGVSQPSINPIDSAIFNFRWIKCKKYVNSKNMTRFIYDGPGNTWSDPGFNYNGALEFYNLMRGYLGIPRYPFFNKFPSNVADYTADGVFLLDGDPVTGTGLIDGIDSGPGGRRLWIVNGPFNMNLGDTAEVVIALVVGMGDNHLASVTKLKHNTKSAAALFHYFVDEMTAGTIQVEAPDRFKTNLLPVNYVLYQNYPNPFNSFTTIKYDLPESAFVSLIIYDVLGREVKRLVYEEKPAGKYSVQFDAGNLSSGVYFYKISFDNVSNRMVFDGLNKTMKLILVK